MNKCASIKIQWILKGQSSCKRKLETLPLLQIFNPLAGNVVTISPLKHFYPWNSVQRLAKIPRVQAQAFWSAVPVENSKLNPNLSDERSLENVKENNKKSTISELKEAAELGREPGKVVTLLVDHQVANLDLNCVFIINVSALTQHMNKLKSWDASCFSLFLGSNLGSSSQ